VRRLKTDPLLASKSPNTSADWSVTKNSVIGVQVCSSETYKVTQKVLTILTAKIEQLIISRDDIKKNIVDESLK